MAIHFEHCHCGDNSESTCHMKSIPEQGNFL